MPAGQVGGEPSPKGQQFTFTVQLQGRLRSVEEFESMVVRTAEEGGLVRLRDVGRVQLGGESYAVMPRSARCPFGGTGGVSAHRQ